MSEKTRVKFLSRARLPDANIGADYLRRFPERIPVWQNCQFTFDLASRDYDWLVVYDDLPRDHSQEPLACDPANTLLITGEPSSITHYNKAFLAQFGHILTSQETWALKHPSILRRQPGLFWYYGGSDDRGTYDALARATPPQKTKSISTVCSTKAMRHTLHSKRLSFTRRLMQDLPTIDVFGYGMSPLTNKADAIDPYRYHLAIENHSCPHHWTEKLADAFLGYSLPIYYGCTNLDTYFPPESYVWFDLHDYDRSLAIIQSLFASDEYSKRLPAIVEARNLVLNEYSTFPQIAAILQATPRRDSQKNPPVIIQSKRNSRQNHPLGWPSEFISKLQMKFPHQWKRK